MIQKQLALDATLSATLEDVMVDTILYQLHPRSRWYPKPESITGYSASLVFKCARDVPLNLQIPTQETLDSLIELLIDLKAQWKEKEKEVCDGAI